MTIPVSTKGRLTDVKEFEELIVRALPDGSLVRLKDVARIELGAHAFGPDAEPLAAAMAESVSAWSREQRLGSGPVVTAWPIDAAVPEADLLAVRKHVRLALNWP